MEIFNIVNLALIALISFKYLLKHTMIKVVYSP